MEGTCRRRISGSSAATPPNACSNSRGRSTWHSVVPAILLANSGCGPAQQFTRSVQKTVFMHCYQMGKNCTFHRSNFWVPHREVSQTSNKKSLRFSGHAYGEVRTTCREVDEAAAVVCERCKGSSEGGLESATAGECRLHGNTSMAVGDGCLPWVEHSKVVRPQCLNCPHLQYKL